MRKSTFLGVVVMGLVVGAWASLALAQPIEVDSQPPFYPKGRPLEGLVITLDPGHGGSAHQEGYHGSARGTNSRIVEGDLNMLVAAEVRHYLMQAGATVYMTRWDDRKVTYGPSGRADELGARVQVAVDTRSHLFLAIHHNSTERRTADGVVVLIWPTDSNGNDQPLETAFADCLRDEVKKVVHQKEFFNHYLNEHPLVTDSDMPSAVIEFGFLSNPEFDAWVSQPGIHRTEALGVYNAVVCMWEKNRKALEAKRRELFPDAENVPVPTPAPEFRPDTEARYANVAKKIWPFDAPPVTADDLNRLIGFYKSMNLSDSTFFYLDAKAEQAGEQWVLKGACNHPIVRTAIEGVLKAAGVSSVRNEIELLPSSRLGDNRFGVVQIPMAMTWAAPKEGASVQTQLLLGERVFLLDVSPDQQYLLLHGGDGYVGWVRREAIREMDDKEFEYWNTTPRALVTREFMADDFRIPTGARLPVLGVEGRTTATLRLPKGIRALDGAEELEIPVAMLLLPPETPPGRTAALTAVEYLTTPYVFGGKSRLGLDCSGLTSLSYASVGVVIPRDARQQVLVGSLVGTPWHQDDLQPGDLLFFVDDSGKLIHTAVSLGGDLFIHASPPEVYVSSLSPLDPLYNAFYEPRFAFARRPMP